ncbi:hypothetical protein NA655_13895 [Pseudomonas kuykendallii]|uniref:PsiF repeat-containing protein n=1 Tax=Pseudomonas kuykendallii TaxID=1007099 RepID=A0A1H2T7E9_9PSED|nr:hypothetical protein [Pseudomonas kuykendallii]MCQ4272116.1 hypothetical protein [Pseudomonas kuykendallii]SDW39873.1 hypothetical protein SAMN05216287_0900 [Pseudomonas kuykendallii]
MRYARLIAFAAPLFVAFSATAAQWPAGAKEEFTNQCVTSAKANVPAAKAEAYCGCAAEKVGMEFSTAEIEAMQNKKGSDVTPEMKERLGKASTSCLHYLNP